MAANIALTRARAALNLSQEELARAINRIGARGAGELRCSARQISKWEAGETRWPQARYRRALEEVTGLTCERLGFAPPDVPELPRPQTVSAPRAETVSEGGPMYRRQFLTAAAGLAAAAMVNPFGGEAAQAATEAGYEESYQTLLRLEQLELRLGSGQLLPLVEEQRRRLSVALHSGAESTALKTLAARAHQLAGWMHFDSGHQQQARKLWKESLFLGQIAGDRGSVAYTSSLMSLQASQLDRPKEAVQLARLGAAQVPPGGLPAALLAVREARGWALLGAARESAASMKLARAALDAPGPRPDWSTFFTDGEMEVWEALIARDLGQWDEAESHARRCVADPALLPRPRASFQLVLSLILLQRGDLKAATEEIDLVLPMLPALSSARVRSRVRDVLTALPPGNDLGGLRAELAAAA